MGWVDSPGAVSTVSESNPRRSRDCHAGTQSAAALTSSATAIATKASACRLSVAMGSRDTFTATEARDQNRCRTSLVVRPPGSVMVAVSGPLNWIVTGATLSESRALGFHAPVSV